MASQQITPIDSKGSASPSDEKAPANAEVSSLTDKDAPGEIERGDLHRALKPRQISMIAIGGAIGTGLIIGTGAALSQGGPAGLLIGYTVMGAVCFCVMCALGEMSASLPHKRGFTGYATDFVDPAFGLATGYNYLCKYLIVTPNQLSASAILVSYWAPRLQPAVTISIFFVAVLALNLLGIRYFGEIEFWLSFAKIIVLTGLIILGIVLDLGGGPTGDRIGFRYWTGLDQAFNEYKVPGALGRFLGVWSVMTLSLFAYMGSELVGVCVGETANPRKAIPSAIKKTFFRILFFYIIGSTLCGMLVPQDDPRLVGSAGAKKGTASSSPFVIAIVRAQIPILPSLVNACLLLFTLSASNSDLYIGTRTLYGLAADGKAPKIFLNCNKRGVPYYALALCSAFCGLAYMSSSTGGAQAFGYLTSTVSIFGGLTWCSILFSHIRFMKACKVEGISRADLPYKSPVGPYGSWAALILTMIVLFFKGFASFIGPRFDYRSFITHYIGLPVFAILYFGSKIMWRSKLVKLDEMNLRERARTFDDLDIKEDEEDAPRNFKEKAAHWVKNW